MNEKLLLYHRRTEILRSQGLDNNALNHMKVLKEVDKYWVTKAQLDLLKVIYDECARKEIIKGIINKQILQRGNKAK